MLDYLLKEYYYTYLFTFFAFGACIGSFLNVCIYRLPRELSVNKPRRSFCTSCKKQIPWYFNLPIISWLVLGGKCKYCNEKISYRYFFVEILNASIYLALARYYEPEFAICYAILCSFLIVAFFIDLEFMIIPDSVTIGGAIVGILLSIIFPTIHYNDKHIWGFYHSMLGFGFGFSIIYFIVIIGKIAFGRVKYDFDELKKFYINVNFKDEEVLHEFKIDSETLQWYDVFYRKSDKIKIKLKKLNIDGKEIELNKSQDLQVLVDKIKIDKKVYQLKDIKHIKGETDSVVIPREAMGFGDVKFMGMMGAFLGWQATIFIVIAASFLGTIYSFFKILVQREKQNAIPFGPYLALGAVLWIICGPKIVRWYQEYTMGLLH